MGSSPGRGFGVHLKESKHGPYKYSQKHSLLAFGDGLQLFIHQTPVSIDSNISICSFLAIILELAE